MDKTTAPAVAIATLAVLAFTVIASALAAPELFEPAKPYVVAALPLGLVGMILTHDHAEKRYREHIEHTAQQQQQDTNTDQ